MRALLVALVVLAPLAAGCLAGDPARPADPSSPVARDDLSPAWSMTDTDGVTHARETAAGKPALLFFMATWCGSCRQKATFLDDLHAELGDRVGFYSIGQDPSETAEDLEGWKARYAHPWPHGLDRDRAIQQAFGVRQQSSFVLVDAEGRVLEKWGYPGASEAQLRDAIGSALAPSSSEPSP